MKKVIIDAGHGINTKGKSSPDCALMEWRYNREIANAIALGLIFRGYDAEVIVPELEDVSLKERVDRVNRIACKYGISESLLLSIHVNAAGNGSQWMNARGWCAYTFPGHTESDDIADCLYLAAEKNLPGQKIRTDYSDGDPDIESAFYVLKHTLCPAVLTENLFMDNKEDCRFLLSSKGRQAIINLHIEGLIEYLDNEEPKAFR